MQNLPTKRSTAYSRSFSTTTFCESRAACNAASLHTFAMSAPENPGVNIANRCEYFVGSFSSDIPVKCFSNISFRSLSVGKSIVMCLSNRPGRSNAYKTKQKIKKMLKFTWVNILCPKHRLDLCLPT